MNIPTIGYFLLGFAIGMIALLVALVVWYALELGGRSDDAKKAHHEEGWYDGLPLENDGM